MSGALRMMLSFNDYVIFKFYFLLTFKAVSFNNLCLETNILIPAFRTEELNCLNMVEKGVRSQFPCKCG